ncbi:MAG TPA: WYL domain-containing protein [Candidatus Dormibacteraeota bacterium]|nr:WYL domain-containing protein [Candidatus Dormibacteraeota bacterium]
MKSKTFDTQPQLNRLHGIVQRIQRGDFPSAKLLAREWEKSWSTIIRDLDFIRDVWKLPLAYHPKRYGFHFTEPVGKFPMVQISERELISVFLAQKALPQYHGTPFEAPLRSAFSKLASSMKGELSVSWRDLDAAISFRGIEANPGDMELLAKLAEAVRTRNEVEFEYHKLFREEEERPSSVKSTMEGRGGTEDGKERGRERERGRGRPEAGEIRRVRPYHLANVGNQWYVFGYDYLRKDIRKFVPARMRNLKVLDARFEKPKDFSIDKMLKGSFAIFSGGEPKQVRIWFGRSRAQVIRERKWHQSQKIKELANGEIEVALELSGFEEVVPWILGWGRHARVRGPRELVKLVKEEARAILRET